MPNMLLLINDIAVLSNNIAELIDFLSKRRIVAAVNETEAEESCG